MKKKRLDKQFNTERIDGYLSDTFVHWKSGRFKFSPNEIGTLGERIVEMLLQKEGFKVKPFNELLYRKRACSKIKALVEICKEKCAICGEPKLCMKYPSPLHIWDAMRIWERCHGHLSEYCSEVCKRFCKNRKILQILDEVGKEQRDRRRGGLDFIAYKDGKIWVVEVKTGTHSELHVSQKQFVRRLRREMGIELLHFHVSLDGEIDYSVRQSRQLPQENFKSSGP